MVRLPVFLPRLHKVMSQCRRIPIHPYGLLRNDMSCTGRCHRQVECDVFDANLSVRHESERTIVQVSPNRGSGRGDGGARFEPPAKAQTCQ
jgi:hypothetical protein